MNLTQDELATRVSLSRGSIANIEAGRQKVLLHHVCLIAQNLNAEPADLLYAQEPEVLTSAFIDTVVNQVPVGSRDFAIEVMKRAQNA